MEDGNLLEEPDSNVLFQDEHNKSPTFLYNKQAVSNGMLWDDGDAVKNAKFTFMWVIVFFIGLYLVYNLYAFLERCRQKIVRPLIPWRLLPGIPSVSSTSPQVENVEPNAALRGRMEGGDGGSVADFVFPPVHHLGKNKGLLHLQPSPMHLPSEKRNPDAEEIIVFLPLFPLSPPSSSLDLSNPEGDREVSLNVTYGSDRNTL